MSSYTTLWNIMSAKQAINDKLQGTVTTCLSFGGVVNKQIMKGLLLSPWVKKIKIGEFLANYKQERDCLVHLCAWPAHC